MADSSRIDSFEIVVDEKGHNALDDFVGPAKVRLIFLVLIKLPDHHLKVAVRPQRTTRQPRKRGAHSKFYEALSYAITQIPFHVIFTTNHPAVGNLRGRIRDRRPELRYHVLCEVVHQEPDGWLGRGLSHNTSVRDTTRRSRGT